MEKSTKETPSEPDRPTLGGLSSTTWRIIAWVTVFVIGFITMVYELSVFY